MNHYCLQASGALSTMTAAGHGMDRRLADTGIHHRRFCTCDYGGFMRRFVPALFHRTPRRQVRSTALPLVEAMERRQLLTASPSDIIENPFPSTVASIQG